MAIQNLARRQAEEVRTSNLLLVLLDRPCLVGMNAHDRLLNMVVIADSIRFKLASVKDRRCIRSKVYKYVSALIAVPCELVYLSSCAVIVTFMIAISPCVYKVSTVRSRSLRCYSAL